MVPDIQYYLGVRVNLLQHVAELLLESLLLLADHAAKQLLFQPFLGNCEIHQGDLVVVQGWKG